MYSHPSLKHHSWEGLPPMPPQISAGWLGPILAPMGPPGGWGGKGGKGGWGELGWGNGKGEKGGKCGKGWDGSWRGNWSDWWHVCMSSAARAVARAARARVGESRKRHNTGAKSDGPRAKRACSPFDCEMDDLKLDLGLGDSKTGASAPREAACLWVPTRRRR